MCSYVERGERGSDGGGRGVGCCPPWLLRCTHHHALQSAVCSQQAPIGAAGRPGGLLLRRRLSNILWNQNSCDILAVLSPPRVPTPAPTQCQGLLRLLSMRFLATPKVLSPSPVIAPPEPLHVLFICRLAHRLIPLARTPFFCGERTAPSAVLPIFPRLKIFSALPLFRTEQSQCAG